MSKLYKRIQILLVFVITLLTASGCFGKDTGNETNTTREKVQLISAPATSTAKLMTEALYLGYLGAQRDFALVVDNAEYSMNNKIQNCGEQEGSPGCASTLAKLILNHGIKTSHFTGESGAEKLLIYYTTSDQFNNYGNLSDDDENGSWAKHLTANEKRKSLNPDNKTKSGNSSTTNKDIINNDTINRLTCGTAADHHNICKYSKELSEKGYSNSVGNSMIILFENGDVHSIIEDKRIDPKKTVDLSTTNFDDLKTAEDITKPIISAYYDKTLELLKDRIRVSNATYNYSTSSGSPQELNVIKSIYELERLIAGDKGSEFLLLITADGFIQQKIGSNRYEIIPGIWTDDNITEGLSDTQEAAMVLLNSVSTYIDNCAVESSPMLNFLKSLLQAIFAGTIGGLAGAGVGALIGSAFGPVGAGIGAVIGGILGIFAGIAANQKLEEKMKAGNGISDYSYCKIVATALDEVEINVPIYTYNISSASTNIKKYNEGSLDSRLDSYYRSNLTSCLTQYQYVSVPSGILSFLSDDYNDSYKYADACEYRVVSNVVGGFGGSPSLQLYLKDPETLKPHRVDDLYGRVTTELIQEMLVVWGLKSVGDIYSLTSTSTMNEMSVVFASAQKLSSAYYCISNDKIPSCNGKNKTPINLNGRNYLYIFEKVDDNDGIELDFTSQYKQYSNERVSNRFTTSALEDMEIAVKVNNNSAKYYHKELNSSSWSSKNLIGVDELESEIPQLLSKVKESIASNLDGDAYEVTYRGINYLVCGNDEVVGYILKDGKIQVVYYQDATTEYIFAGVSDGGLTAPLNPDVEDVDTKELNKEKYYHYIGRAEKEIDADYGFYVYVEYNIEGDSTPHYYSYVV